MASIRSQAEAAARWDDAQFRAETERLRSLLATRAPVVYVANVATQPGETDGYDLDRHVDAIAAHLGRPVIQLVLANDNLSIPYPAAWGVGPVRPELRAGGPTLVAADVLSVARPTRHDPAKLAAAVVGLIRDGGGRRERGAG